jgi:hypothetical protein
LELEQHPIKTYDISNLAVVGIDIGKVVFHLVGFDDVGKLVLRKMIKRLALTSEVLLPTRVG